MCLVGYNKRIIKIDGNNHTYIECNEKRFNPRLQVNNEKEYVKIMNDLNLPKPKLIDLNIASNIKLGAI